jgi:hypothetical protein
MTNDTMQDNFNVSGVMAEETKSTAKKRKITKPSPPLLNVDLDIVVNKISKKPRPPKKKRELTMSPEKQMIEEMNFS